MCIGGLACLADAEPSSEEQCNIQDCNSINPLPKPQRRVYGGPYQNMFNDGHNETDVKETQDTTNAPRGEIIPGNATSNEITEEKIHDITEKSNEISDAVDNSVLVGKIGTEENTVLNTAVLPSTTAINEITTIKVTTVTPTTPEIVTPSPHHKWIPLFWKSVSSSFLYVLCFSRSYSLCMSKLWSLI